MNKFVFAGIILVIVTGNSLAQPISGGDDENVTTTTTQPGTESSAAGFARGHIGLSLYGALGTRVQGDKSLPVDDIFFVSTFSANLALGIPLGRSVELFAHSGYGGLTHGGSINISSIRSLAGFNFFLKKDIALFAAGIIDYDFSGNVRPERTLGDAAKKVSLSDADLRQPAGGAQVGARFYIMQNNDSRFSFAAYGHYQTTALKLDFLGVGINAQIDFLF